MRVEKALYEFRCYITETDAFLRNSFEKTDFVLLAAERKLSRQDIAVPPAPVQNNFEKARGNSRLYMATIFRKSSSVLTTL